MDWVLGLLVGFAAGPPLGAESGAGAALVALALAGAFDVGGWFSAMLDVFLSALGEVRVGCRDGWTVAPRVNYDD